MGCEGYHLVSKSSAMSPGAAASRGCSVMLVAGAAWHTERVNTACYVLPLATSAIKTAHLQHLRSSALLPRQERSLSDVSFVCADVSGIHCLGCSTGQCNCLISHAAFSICVKYIGPTGILGHQRLKTPLKKCTVLSGPSSGDILSSCQVPSPTAGPIATGNHS